VFHSISGWALWGFVLILQNFMFTQVSRARNSGSLARHAIAGVFSNGVWFISQTFIFSRMFAMMTGKYGTWAAIGTGAFYTALTLIGSISAHYFALHTEKGKSAVGSNKKYAQITVEEWARIKALVDSNVS
jgi:hypothetical protein